MESTSINHTSKQFQANSAILRSEEHNKILKLIDSLRSEGDARYVEPLVDCMVNTKVDKIRDSIYSLLLDLKDDDAVVPLLSCIKNDNYTNFRTQLLSILWQSNVDASPYLNELVEMAIDFDYLSAIEIMTVLDTFEEGFTEEQLMECIYLLDDAISTEESNKAELLTEIKSIINKLMID